MKGIEFLRLQCDCVSLVVHQVFTLSLDQIKQIRNSIATMSFKDRNSSEGGDMSFSEVIEIL